MMSCGEEAGWYRFQELEKVLRKSKLNCRADPLSGYQKKSRYSPRGKSLPWEGIASDSVLETEL
jgi:hypothetical protein